MGGVWRRAGHRHAADRVADHRDVDRGVDQRPPANRRDPVRRLHLPGVQPAHLRSGPHALPLEQRIRPAHDGPRPVRRWRAWSALPQPVGRGVLHPHSWAQGRHPVDPIRRQGVAPLVDPERGSCPLLRAQEDVPERPWRRPRRRVHGSARQGRRHPSRHPGDGDRLRSHGPLRPRGGRSRRR